MTISLRLPVSPVAMASQFELPNNVPVALKFGGNVQFGAVCIDMRFSVATCTPSTISISVRKMCPVVKMVAIWKKIESSHRRPEANLDPRSRTPGKQKVREVRFMGHFYLLAMSHS
jgi:hypothetical protein